MIVHSQSGRPPLYLKNACREFRKEYMKKNKRTTSLAHRPFRSCSEGRPFTEANAKKRSLLLRKIDLCALLPYQMFTLISSQNALINANTEKWCDGVPSLSSSRAKGTGSLWIKPFRIGARYGNGYGEVERSTALIRIRR